MAILISIISDHIFYKLTSIMSVRNVVPTLTRNER
jgi:hypothetical protein